MRYTEYHCGVPVVKDKSILSDALAKLAKYEDIEEDPELDEVLRGLYKAKSHALSNYSKDRIQAGIRLIIKLANFDETESERVRWLKEGRETDDTDGSDTAVKDGGSNESCHNV